MKRQTKIMISLIALTIISSIIVFNLNSEKDISFSPPYCRDTDGGQKYYRAGTVSVEIVGEIEIITNSEIPTPNIKEIQAANSAQSSSSSAATQASNFIDETLNQPAPITSIPITADQTTQKNPSLGVLEPSIGERPRPNPNYNYYYDTCLDSRMLKEYFCKANYLTHGSRNYYCPTSCQNGACVAECNDGTIEGGDGGEVCDSDSLYCETTEQYPGGHECFDDCSGYNMTECLTTLYCGDNLVNGTEECDDGNTVEGDGCDNNCVLEFCGDGDIDPSEECDDGNNDDGDGCDKLCNIEICGNGILQVGEECDDGIWLDTNYTINSTDDDDFCVMDLLDSGASCIINICGDGYLNTSSEECDLGTENNDTECSTTYNNACNYCNTTCNSLTIPGGLCGDSIIQGPDETCDDGNVVSGDGCDSNCQTETGGNGGNSGNSGGNRNPPPPETDYLSAIPSELSLEITKDVSKEFALVISNSLNRDVTVTLATENLDDTITFNKASLVIPAEEQESIRFNVLATEENLLAGKILVQENRETKLEILTVILVRAIGYLFDAQITIAKTTLYPGDELVSQITLLQVGEQVKLDVTANYILKDFEGNIYDEESEMLAVEGRQDYTKRFATESLPPGEYILGLEIVYPDAFATASDRFTIIEREPRFNWWPIIIGAIILIAMILIILILKKKKKHKKKK